MEKLIKPSEVNQARLFSVDTRIKEGELTRLKDLQFMRDTFKKLIYAIEQASMARQATSSNVSEGRPVSYGGKRTGKGQGLTNSVADQNFGVTAHSILPSVHEGNLSMQNAKMTNHFS